MRLVVFDLEANADSPHPENQEIVEIGALAVAAGEVIEEFHSFVAPTPGRSLHSLTVKLTGITEEMLLGAPLRRAALSKFLDFCGGAPLVAHNGHGYDYPLLVAELGRAGLREPVGKRLDSLDLARSVFGRGSPRPGCSPPLSRRLSDLADYYGVGQHVEPAHCALADARTLWEVIRSLLDDLTSDAPTMRIQRRTLKATDDDWSLIINDKISFPRHHDGGRYLADTGQRHWRANTDAEVWPARSEEERTRSAGLGRTP